MRKRHLLLLLLAGLIYGCTGRTAVEDPERAERPLIEDDFFVTPEKAQEIASELPIEGTLRLLGTDKTAPETRSIESSTTEYQPAYYLFGGDEGGYAIVAASERAYPILGYSETGSIDPENIPCGLRMMLDIYAEQINQARALDLMPLKTRSEEVDPADIIVAPLLRDITWDQGMPYNGMTPGGAPIGCVATAVAQIMRYWKYPDHAVGTHGYMSRNNGYLEHDYNYRIEWDQMPESPNGTYSDPGGPKPKPNPTIARFIYGIAVAVDMNFTYAGSGTTHIKVPPALIRHYGYSKEIRLVAQQEVGNKWAGIIKEELDAGRPVLHGGSGDGGGHSFVCDGYTKGDLFHFNWGWSGLSNGWYRLNALNPDDLGTGGGQGGGYNRNRDIVIRIAPPARILGDNTGSTDIATDDPESSEEEVKAIDNGVPYKSVMVFEPLDLFAGFVKINNMSNPSAGDGYTLYNQSDKLIQAKAGEKLEIEIETERTNFFTTPVIGLYIDYNDNGIFYYANNEGKETIEEDMLFLDPVPLGTFKTSYTIPADAKKGIHRLRVVLNDGTKSNKESEDDFFAVDPNAAALLAGEVEDYFIEIK